MLATLASIIVIIITNSSEAINIGHEIKIISLIRTLTLIKSFRNLRVIFSTLVSSIPGIANTGAMILMLVFIYAILGIQIFSGVARNSYGLSDWFNFESFGNAFLSLLAVGTGDSGPGIMLASIREYSIDF
jgi:hypothetical protein